jgi:hypothetical protein
MKGKLRYEAMPATIIIIIQSCTNKQHVDKQIAAIVAG